MVVKLTPDQISAHWNNLKITLIRAAPPTAEVSETGLNSILSKLLADEMQSWVFLEDSKIKATMFTMFVRDPGMDHFNLLVYSVYGLDKIVDELWKEAWGVVREFAKKCHCKKIIGFTNVPRVVEVVEGLGGKAEFTLISLEV